MEVQFTPEQEAQILEIANYNGTPAEQLVKQGALRMVEETVRFRAAVRGGIAQADQGELIEDDAVRHWLERQENP